MFGDDYVGDSAIVRVHVMNLRRKLGRDGERIANLPRQGYFLAR
jgi:DNA-binding response OmpR family regulator